MIPAAWTVVDDELVSSASDWYLFENTGADMQHDGWAAYEASNIWGNYPGDNQLTGTYLVRDGQFFDEFIVEMELFSQDNDGTGFVFGYRDLGDHFTATEINDQWPNPPADGYGGPHQKIRKRSGMALPTMDDSNNVYSLLPSDDGDDGLSVNKANYSPYAEGVIMNMALKVEKNGAEYFMTFLSSRHDANGGVEGAERLTAHLPGDLGRGAATSPARSASSPTRTRPSGTTSRSPNSPTMSTASARAPAPAPTPPSAPATARSPAPSRPCPTAPAA